MSAIVAPNGTADLIQQALTLVESPDDMWEAAVSLANDLIAHIDAKRAGLGVLTDGVERRYGTGAVERWAEGVRGYGPASLYDFARWVRIAGGPHEAISLIAKGYTYNQQRTAMRHCPDTETFLARLTGAALPAPSDAPARPRKVVDAQRGVVEAIGQRGRVIINVGALAIDLQENKRYRMVFYEIEETETQP